MLIYTDKPTLYESPSDKLNLPHLNSMNLIFRPVILHFPMNIENKTHNYAKEG